MVAGKSAWGIELSEAVLKSECPDLLEKKVSMVQLCSGDLQTTISVAALRQ